ncbi:LLM class flavin-dependent oxidoreductase [Pelagibacterium lacus]|uniref:FMN-dependent monooxygenase n=1 Tax=Pelagibacterium lacus TaxID=2282655 RepID=A0A369W868_9HYPH|nr:LLM class flavin-dependent oxidoreductase [Pelagibacterium lacus]RDE10533.1 FMN-dependent monooxygenase [Pelagibacterium lacus]
MTRKRQMRLGLSIRGLGYHLAAWRHEDMDPGGALDFHHFLKSAQIAEAAKFDLVFLADSVAVRQRDEPAGSLCRSSQNVELEPITLLTAIAARTSHIGVVATGSTSYNEPYHIARKFASLDHISGGRAGWNVVTSWSDEEARNFNRDQHFDYDTRYERAAEFVDVVAGLWNSWEDDAFVRDKASGVFYDPAKRHVLNHVGKHFKVQGPLSSARTPQGRPIISQAGANDAGKEIAARYADMVYTGNVDIEPAKAFYASLKSMLPRYGRHPDELKIMPAISPYVGRTEQEARDKFEELQALIDPAIGLQQIYRQLGDMSAYPLDGPVPPPPADVEMVSDAQRLYNMAQKDNLTIRQLYERVAAASSMRVVVGSAEQIADTMEEWFTQGAADGFNICPPMLPHSAEEFCELVVPELQRRGLFRTEYEGTTLRENLGAAPQPFPAP